MASLVLLPGLACDEELGTTARARLPPAAPWHRLPDADRWRRQRRTDAARASRELAHAIPGARLAFIERCGHMLTLEQPSALNVLLLEWLNTMLLP